VCMDPKLLTLQTIPPSFLRGSADNRTEDGCRVPITGQKMAADARVPRQRYIRDSSWSCCDVTRSYCKCVAPWVMHKTCGDVNGKHMCRDDSVIGLEASE
jgi:hypothetical protein